MIERRIRLLTALVLVLFVTAHLLNTALGIFSMELMESGRKFRVLIWQSIPGTMVLYGSMLVHLLLVPVLALSGQVVSPLLAAACATSSVFMSDGLVSPPPRLSELYSHAK